MGNLTVSPRHELNASIKKRFWKDRFTVSASVKNLLDRDDRFEADQPGFIRTLDVSQNWGKRSFQLRVSYNFKSGKSFRSRSVESSASEEKGGCNETGSASSLSPRTNRKGEGSDGRDVSTSGLKALRST